MLFYVTPSVQPSRKLICRLIELSGGKVLDERPSGKHLTEFIEACDDQIVRVSSHSRRCFAVSLSMSAAQECTEWSISQRNSDDCVTPPLSPIHFSLLNFIAERHPHSANWLRK